MWTIFVYLLLCVVLYLCYQIYKIPIPKGCSNPGTLRKLHTANKVIAYICLLVELLGISSQVKVKKYLTKNRAAASKKDTDGVTTEDTVFDGVPVRVYTPTGGSTGRPGMVYYHGGGWTIGDLNMVHTMLGMMAKAVGMVVTSVDYRLCPEYSVKDGFDDCVAATKYFINNADKFSVDPNRICIGGDSAGGNFTAVVALYLRDNNFTPMPKIQLLIYPLTQFIELQLPSYQQHAGGPFQDRRESGLMKSTVFSGSPKYRETFMSGIHVSPDIREKYAETLVNPDLLPAEMLYPPYKRPVYQPENPEMWAKVKQVLFDPYRYPLMAESHENLPETYIFTCEYDMLRDDGLLYARKLKEAKVKVTHRHCPVGWHGMIHMVYTIDDTTQEVLRIIDFLKQKL